MTAAPFHRDVAAGPARVEAWWIEAADGMSTRAAFWPDGARGSVALFPGRTEYVEKYAEAAAQLGRRGYATATIDWRGQGLTGRAGRHRMLGHVGDFDGFQRDVDALVAAMARRGMPRPWHLLAHSMGGLIGLRTLTRGAPFERVAFSAPMWGLPLPPPLRLAAWTASHLGALLGVGTAGFPGSGKGAEPAAAAFEGNLLTTDPERFAWMKRQIAAHPELALGGPTVGWLRAALREMRALSCAPSPAVPCLTLLGTDEYIVDADAIRDRMGGWPDGRLVVVEGARHEVLMEGPAVRERLFDAIADHLGGRGGA